MAKKFTIIFLAIVILIGGFFLLSYQKKISISSNGGEKLLIEEPNITFVLLGKTGKVIGWNLSPNLVDTIMVVDYHPKIGALNIVSLPRDLYVNLGTAQFKLNEVAERNKIIEFTQELPEITGINTDKYVVVDIDLLKKVVDELGGIDVVLESRMVDWASGYTIESGQQHLDGNQVVWVVRNRYAPQGDFFREKNQHLIIRAIFDKFKSLGPIQKTTFLFKMLPDLTKLDTNVNFQELMPIFDKVNGMRFNNVVLDFSTGLLQSSTTTIGTSSAYILVPRKGIDNYEEVKNFIQGKLER